MSVCEIHPAEGQLILDVNIWKAMIQSCINIESAPYQWKLKEQNFVVKKNVKLAGTAKKRNQGNNATIFSLVQH